MKRMVVILMTVSLISSSGLAQTAPPSVALYIADAGNHRIVRIEDMGEGSWTAFNKAAANEIGDPYSVSVDGVGRIYIAEHFNHRITRIADSDNNRIVRINDMDGSGWTTLGRSGSGTNQFVLPFGVFVDRVGRIYVSDWGNARIVRVNDMTGAGWTAVGTAEAPECSLMAREGSPGDECVGARHSAAKKPVRSGVSRGYVSNA